MAKETLVDEYVDEAINLISTLDNSSFTIDSALWFYFIDADEWRLLIATPIVDKIGTLETYKKFIEFIKDNKIFVHTPIRKLTVVSPNDPLIRLLKMAIRTGPTISRIRFQNNIINNTQIEDALIYRLQ